MRKRLAGVTLALAIAMLGIPRLVQAQRLTGHISGTVTDATGGALPGVANTFGRLNRNTNSARRIQLGARFTF